MTTTMAIPETGITQATQQWDYLALNLKKVAGPMTENEFNKRGAEGWEFVAVAQDYAIFKRPRH